jgi:hypothetical protein
MDAEEIIQQKEWHQLTTDDHRIVAELAETEQEYNLLKKMLQLSANEPLEVPTISASIKENLQQEFTTGKVVSIKKYWYAVAAAILILASAALFILNKKDAPHIIPGNETVKNIIVPETEQKDTAIKNDPVIKKEAPQIVHHQQNIKQQVSPIVSPVILPVISPTPNIPSSDVSLALNNKVADQKELLNLVTEIY